MGKGRGRGVKQGGQEDLLDHGLCTVCLLCCACARCPHAAIVARGEEEGRVKEVGGGGAREGPIPGSVLGTARYDGPRSPVMGSCRLLGDSQQCWTGLDMAVGSWAAQLPWTGGDKVGRSPCRQLRSRRQHGRAQCLPGSTAGGWRLFGRRHGNEQEASLFV